VKRFVRHPERLGEGRAQDLNGHLTQMGEVTARRGLRSALPLAVERKVLCIQPSGGTSGAAVLLGMSNAQISGSNPSAESECSTGGER